MRIWWTMTIGAALVACSGDGKDDEKSGDDDDAAGLVDCADPASNPYAGTCVETFMAGCFDPSGECDVSIAQTGSTDLTWANGAAVESSIGFEGASVVTDTDYVASDGTICAEGVTRVMDAGCDSRTVLTRPSDGAVMEYCLFQDGSMDITCPDGSSFSVDAADGTAAQSCQYGSDAGACTI